MKRSISLILIVRIATAFSVTAHADVRSATACASGLTPDQRLIYHSVMLELTSEANLSVLIRSKVVALVTAGRLPMSSAPDDAKVAGRCLQMVHQ